MKCLKYVFSFIIYDEMSHNGQWLLQSFILPHCSS